MEPASIPMQEKNKAEILEFIKQRYLKLGRIERIEITTYGPARPDGAPGTGSVIQTTGKKIKHASSNPSQGKWLTELAQNSVKNGSGDHTVLEIGTCAGISAMYLIAGLYLSSPENGHLVTFEGSHELAEIAETNLRDLIEYLGSENLSFEIVTGSLDETFTPRLNVFKSSSLSVDLAFIDGNHLEDATLTYHNAVRRLMSRGGIIVHDDISWGDGMKRAWQKIQQLESAHSIDELLLGGIPSRGIIFLDDDKRQNRKIHTDNIFSRSARTLKRTMKRS